MSSARCGFDEAFTAKELPMISKSISNSMSYNNKQYWTYLTKLENQRCGTWRLEVLYNPHTSFILFPDNTILSYRSIAPSINQPRIRKAKLRGRAFLLITALLRRFNYLLFGEGGVRALRRYQRTTDFLLPKLPFSRVVRDILQDAGHSRTPVEYRIQSSPLETLQEEVDKSHGVLSGDVISPVSKV